MSKTLYLLFSHTLNDMQKNDAFSRYGITNIIALPDELQKVWSQIPADISQVKPFLKPIMGHLSDLKKTDYVLVQGDAGASFVMVEWIRSKGATAIYATTKRNVTEEKIENGKTTKTTVFQHIRYRIYGE